MREIKFRAWSVSMNMYYFPDYCAARGSLLTIKDGEDWALKYHHHILDNKEDEFLASSNNGDILEQYTGLKDKNGKEIYEGDIVYLAGYGEYVVEWPFFDLWEKVICGNQDDIGTIKGNIHENPELLS